MGSLKACQYIQVQFLTGYDTKSEMSGLNLLRSTNIKVWGLLSIKASLFINPKKSGLSRSFLG